MSYTPTPKLKLRRIGIDTYKEAIVYIRADSFVCRAEGFEAQARVLLKRDRRSMVATLNIIHTELLRPGEIGLSEYAWQRFGARERQMVAVSHAAPVKSLTFLRSKIYGHRFKEGELYEVISDIVEGRYSDIQISSFLTACAGGKLTKDEILFLTKAMVEQGKRLTWGQQLVVDKHCIGGLPGNRTSPIIVAIAAAYGLTMPKTSSRAITSPAGTADTMEVLTNVDLDLKAMKKVVEQTGGCVVWGGAVSLSPADDVLIRVEKALDIDAEGQMVASILSKKLAAGSSHVLIDVPVGQTAKIRSTESAALLVRYLKEVGAALGMQIRCHMSDGRQPIGRGLGPSFEARDVLAVLRNQEDAPRDLRRRALELAGLVLEFAPDLAEGQGQLVAEEILTKGLAWKKFEEICEAQGGLRELPKPKHCFTVEAAFSGRVHAINNRHIARIAKLAGAPQDKAAGVDLHTALDSQVSKGEPLYTVCAESSGELAYAVDYLKRESGIMTIKS